MHRGVYESLRMAYIQRNAPLPADKRTLYGLAEAIEKTEQRAVDAVLSAKFSLDSQAKVYRSVRCDAELARIADAKARAQKAAKARWDRDQEKRDADAMQPHMQVHAPSICMDTCIDDANQISNDPNILRPKEKNTYISEEEGIEDVPTGACAPPEEGAHIEQELTTNVHLPYTSPVQPLEDFSDPPLSEEALRQRRQVADWIRAQQLDGLPDPAEQLRRELDAEKERLDRNYRRLLENRSHADYV